MFVSHIAKSFELVHLKEDQNKHVLDVDAIVKVEEWLMTHWARTGPHPSAALRGGGEIADRFGRAKLPTSIQSPSC